MEYHFGVPAFCGPDPIAHVTLKISCLYAGNNFCRLAQAHKKSDNLSYW